MVTATSSPPGMRRSRNALKRLAHRLETPLQYFFGDDIFISYSRVDGLNYAQGIANQLAAPGRDYSCRVDLWETVPGVEMPASLRRALRWSKMLVLVGTPGAGQSVNVGLEVEEFLETGGIIIPIDFDQAVPGAIWYQHIQGLPLARETVAALEAGRPSEQVVARVHDSFQYVARSQRVRRTFHGLLALMVLILGAGLGLGWLERRALLEADAQEKGLQAIMLARSPGHELEGLTQAVELAKQRFTSHQAAPDPVFGSLLIGYEAVSRSYALAEHRGRVSQIVVLPHYRLASIATDSTVRFAEWRSGHGKAVLGHLTNCQQAVLSPDSTLLVTTSPLRVWDIRAGQEQVVALAEPPAGTSFRAAAWSSDGRRLAAVSSQEDGANPQIWVWDVARTPDPARVSLMAQEVPWHDFSRQPHTAPVLAIAFLPDQPDRVLLSTTKGVVLGALREPRTRVVGAWHEQTRQPVVAAGVYPAAQVVLTGSNDTIYVRDAHTLRPRQAYWVQGGVYAGPLNSLALSPDARQVVGVFTDAVFLWNRDDHQPGLPQGRIRRVEGTGFQKVVFTPDGRQFLLVDGGKTISLWSSSVIRQRVLTGHLDQITAAEFSTHGRRIITASADGEIRIWNLQLDLAQARWPLAANARQLAFTADDHWLLTGDTLGTIRTLNPTTGRSAGQPAAPAAAEFLADDRVLRVDASGRISLWAAGAPAVPVGHLPGRILDLQQRRQGKTLLALVRPADGGAPILYRCLDGQWKPYTAAPFQAPVAGFLLPAGRGALVLSAAGGITQVELTGFRAGKVLRRESHETWTPELARQRIHLSSSGRFMLVNSPAGAVLLDVQQASGRPLRGYAGGITTAAFSADETHVATGSTDAVARVWDCPTGELRHTLVGHDAGLTAVACAPGDWLATGALDGAVRLWNGATGQMVGVLRGHTGAISALQFTHRGTALWSAGRDGTLRQFTLDPQWYLRRAQELVNPPAVQP